MSAKAASQRLNEGGKRSCKSRLQATTAGIAEAMAEQLGRKLK